MAEIELSVLNRQCLNRRISDKETLIQEVEAWEQQIFQAEETSYQDDEETLAELQQVRDEYQSGDYVTLEQYLSKD